MFQDFIEAATFVRENDIRMIDLKFCDLWGRWHHVTISASEFTPELMEAGIQPTCSLPLQSIIIGLNIK